MTSRRLCPARLRAQAGLSLVEMLVATALLGLVMAAAYSNLISQIRTHATQQLVTESMHDVRSAIRIMSEQIEMAGFGVPLATTPATAARLVTATPTKLTFWTKVTATHTYLAAAATAGTSTITVASATGLKAGMSIYVGDATRWYFGSIRTVSGTSLVLSSSLTYAFAAGAPVTPVEQVTFELVGDELRRNGKRFIDNVTALSFTYDSATLTAIRQITIALSVETRANDLATGRRLPFTLTTRVAPPNLGFS